MMLNETENPMWIVSCVKWRMKRNGRPNVYYTVAQTYRSEEYARGYFREIMNSLRASGYVLTPTDLTISDGREGFQGYCYPKEKERGRTEYVAITLTRNRSWH